jgi:hypothetical protein
LYKWKITPDVEDNNFEPLVSKVIESTQSWFINGCGGSGKTYLVKSIQKYLKDNNIEYCSLAPTNIAALLINGETLNKVVAQFPVPYGLRVTLSAAFARLPTFTMASFTATVEAIDTGCVAWKKVPVTATEFATLTSKLCFAPLRVLVILVPAPSCVFD